MPLHHEDLTRTIIGAAIEVHRALGPGLLERVYRDCLVHELELRGVACQREVELDVVYKGMTLSSGYRMDVVVDHVVIEIKAVESVLPVHKAQLLTYLKLSGKKVGLLLNFNVPLMKDGIIRMIV